MVTNHQRNPGNSGTRDQGDILSYVCIRMGSWLDVHRRGSKRVAMVRHLVTQQKNNAFFFFFRDDVQIRNFVSRFRDVFFTSDRLE